MKSSGHKLKAMALGIAIAVGAGSMSTTFDAKAQFVVFDPVNFMENMMSAYRTLTSNLNEAQQIQNQIQQYRNMVQNTNSLTGGTWDQADNVLGRLSDSLAQGQGLAVTGGQYESQFRSRFPGYSSTENYADSYKRWNETSRDSVFGALRAANIQAQGISNERQAMAALRNAASSTGGQKAALDAGNQIALANVNQLQQLRELMMAQIQAQGTHLAAQDQAAASRAAGVHEATRYRSVRDEAKQSRVQLKGLDR